MSISTFTHFFVGLAILASANLQRANGVSYRIDNLTTGRIIDSFQIAPDSSTVVYDAFRGLRAAPIAGGANVSLTAPFGVNGFQISPDSNFVVYTDDEDTSGTSELYSVAIGGGPHSKLSSPVYPGYDINIQQVGITPNSQRVVYEAKESLDYFELFSAPIAGGGASKINAPLPSGFTVGNNAPYQPFVITADSGTVVYIQRPWISSDPGPTTVFSVPVSGGPATTLAESPQQFQGIGTQSLQITPNGATLTYVLSGLGYDDLYRVPLAGGASTLLTEPAEEGRTLTSPYFISPDGSRILYEGTKGASTDDELFSVSLAGGAIVQVSDPNAGTIDIVKFDVTPDGSRVVFAAFNGTITQFFSSPTSGGENIPLTPPLDPNLVEFKISGDGQNVVFISDFESPGVAAQLYSVPVVGGEISKLNGPLVEFGEVYSFDITPDGKTVVFSANTDSLDAVRLFQVPTVGGYAKRIDTAFSNTFIDYTTLQVSPDGQYVVYQALNGFADELHVGEIVPGNPGPPGDPDFDEDGDVDGFDFLVWQRGFGVGTSLTEGDANGDMNVDELDLAIWEELYGIQPLMASVAVPEPSGLVLVVIGSWFSFHRRPRVSKPQV